MGVWFIVESFKFGKKKAGRGVLDRDEKYSMLLECTLKYQSYLFCLIGPLMVI